MPRKQRFKPSRKPKPPVVEEIQPEPSVHPGAQEIESAEPARTHHDTSSVIGPEESPK